MNDLKKKMVELQVKLEERSIHQVRLEQVIESRIRDCEEKDAIIALQKLRISELEEGIEKCMGREKELLVQLEMRSNQVVEKTKEVKTLEMEIRDLSVSMKIDKDCKFKNLRDQIKNLQNDIDSLNVIIDMRNDTIKSLTDRVSTLEDGVRDLPGCKGMINLLKQKLEQTEITLSRRDELIRSLKEEKQYLTAQIQSTSRITKRLSMRNEELQFALSESFIHPSTPPSGDTCLGIISNRLTSGSGSLESEGLGSEGLESTEENGKETPTGQSMSASYTILDPASSTIFGANTSSQHPSSAHVSSSSSEHAHQVVTRSKTAGGTSSSTKLATPRERFRQNQLKQKKLKTHEQSSDSKGAENDGGSTSTASDTTPSPLSRNNSSLTPTSSPSDSNAASFITPSIDNANAKEQPKNKDSGAPSLERQRTFDSPVSQLPGNSCHAGDAIQGHVINFNSSHVTNFNSSHVTNPSDNHQDGSLNSLSDDIAITNEVWSSDTETLETSRASDVSTLGDPHLDPFIKSTHSIDTRIN